MELKNSMTQEEFKINCKNVCKKSDLGNHGFYLQFIPREYYGEAVKLLSAGFEIEKTYDIIRKLKNIISVDEDGTNLRKLYLNFIILESCRIGVNNVELSPDKVFKKHKSNYF